MLGYDGPAVRIMQFSGYEPLRRPPKAGDAGARVRPPHSPAPTNDTAAADPDADWT
jgi:hypothetical protein